MERLLVSLILLLGLSLNLAAQLTYETAKQQFQVADSLWKQKADLNRAISLFEQSKKDFTELDSTYLALRCELGVVRCLYEMQQDDQVMLRSDEFLADLKRQNIQDTLLAQTYYIRSLVNYFGYQFDTAISLLNRALVIFESAKGTTPYIVNSYWMLGANYSEIQRFFESFEYYEQAIAHSELIRNHDGKIRTQFSLNRNLGILKGNLGQFDEAFAHFETCLNLQSEHSELLGENAKAQIFANIGYGHLKVGNLSKAKEYMERSLAIQNNPDIQNNLGLVLTDMGFYDEAMSIFEEFLTKSPEEDTKGKMYTNIARIHHLKNDTDQAIEYLGRALRVLEPIGDKQTISIVLRNLGANYYDRGEFEISKKYLKQAIKEFPQQSYSILSKLSEVFFALDSFDSALYYGEKSVLDSEGNFRFEVTTPSKIEKLTLRVELLAYFYARYFEYTGDSSYLDKLMTLCEDFHAYLDQFHSTYSNLSVSLNARSIRAYEYGIMQMTRQKDNSGQELHRAFEFSEWSKVELLSAGQRSERARSLSGIPDDLIALDKNLKIKESHYMTQIRQLENSGDTVKAKIQQTLLFETVKEQDSLLNIFRTIYPRYHQLRYDKETISVEDVQDKLTSQQAFLEYFQGDSASFVFLITKDQYEVLPIGLQNDSLILELRSDFREGEYEKPLASYAQKAYDIYQRYLDPAIRLLGDEIRELIVVPDGNLSYIPFDILVTDPKVDEGPKSLAYLLLDYQVHYTYSAALYFNDFSSLSRNNKYLAFAPQYSGIESDTSVVRGLGNFRNQIIPLKYNSEEVTFISSQFQGLGFMGKGASERNFKNHVEDYGVLHLAMHAILDDQDPMNSKLVFTPTGDSLEDDLLHAFEIYNMEIPSQLTVLSACETGFGQLAKGEGALSLARAFSYAGSPSVVMSHWPVDDQTTAQLMQYFYHNLGKGQSKSEALRAAKLEFLRGTHPARAHPFFWGSFAVMGNDDPLQLSYLRWIRPSLGIVIGLIVLGSIGFVVIRKKSKAPTDS